MTLLEQIQKDMVSSMKEKDSFTLGVLRMVKGAVQLEAINKKKELSDDEVVSVIAKQIKMRNDSIAEFEKAGRDDLVEQNKKEVVLLNKYMPAQLSDDEINNVIDEVFSIVNPSGIKDMGSIMKEISPRVKGKADMGKVNAIIKDRLSKL
ncbi:MAG: GatB/YqeY domain-containing protein [Bacilli bacterium]|nr:GatB/YqeY domain-containing protein [Bacilli bacterium]